MEQSEQRQGDLQLLPHHGRLYYLNHGREPVSRVVWAAGFLGAGMSSAYSEDGHPGGHWEGGYPERVGLGHACTCAARRSTFKFEKQFVVEFLPFSLKEPFRVIGLIWKI